METEEEDLEKERKWSCYEVKKKKKGAKVLVETVAGWRESFGLLPTPHYNNFPGFICLHFSTFSYTVLFTSMKSRLCRCCGGGGVCKIMVSKKKFKASNFKFKTPKR